MSSTCAKLRCGAVLMHTRGHPNEWKTQSPLANEEVVPIVLTGLRQRTEHALEAGIERSRIVVDPGFGFGKIRRENYPMLAHFSELNALGYPLLAGLSRKSFLSPECFSEPKTNFQARIRTSLLSATVAANTVAILAGAHILRVHDVAEARGAADLADALLSVEAVN
jgi:dihydropteroate synthase